MKRAIYIFLVVIGSFFHQVLFSMQGQRQDEIWFDGCYNQSKVFDICDERIVSLDVSRDATLMGIGFSAGDIKVWDLFNKKERYHLFGHSNSVTSVKISSDGEKMISSSLDKTTKLWNLKTGNLIWSLSHMNQVISSAISFSNDFFAIAIFDENNINNCAIEVRSISEPTCLINKFSEHDKLYLAVATTNKGLGIIEADGQDTKVVLKNIEWTYQKSLSEQVVFDLNRVSIQGIGISYDSEKIAGIVDNSVAIYRVKFNKDPVYNKSDYDLSVCCFNENDTVFCGTNNGKIILFNPIRARDYPCVTDEQRECIRFISKNPRSLKFFLNEIQDPALEGIRNAIEKTSRCDDVKMPCSIM